jgi:hypothetical protein
VEHLRGYPNLTSSRAICHRQALFAASKPLFLASVANLEPSDKSLSPPRGAPTPRRRMDRRDIRSAGNLADGRQFSFVTAATLLSRRPWTPAPNLTLRL